MTGTLMVFLLIIVFFVVLLILKNILNLRFCVLCVSISLTWICLLLLYWFHMFNNIILVSVLMGQSILGVYYLLEKKVKEKFQIFRLPFILTLTFIAYLLLGISESGYFIFWILLVLWLIFVLVYMYRDNVKFKKIFDKLIACCRDW